MTTTINGKATDLITFTRDSLATVTDSDGKIKWAPHNLLPASEQFDASSWTKTNATVTANAVAAPNGTTTADRLVETTDNANHYISTTHTTVANGVYTFSVFGQEDQRRYITVAMGGVNAAFATFDLQSGTVTGSATTAGTGWSSPSAAITPIGGGWYLCSITATDTVGQVRTSVVSISNVSTNPADGLGNSYSGSTANGIYLWGAHLYRSDLGMQANASAYPYYNPSTPKNLLGYSEAISNAAWVGLGGVAAAPTKGTVTGTRPNGSSGTIDTLTFPAVAATQWSAVYQNTGVTYLNTPITFSVYARVASGSGTIYLNVEDLGAGPTGGNFIASTAKTLTTEWQRISVTGTRTSNTGNAIVVIGFDTRCGAGQTNASSLTVELWGAQLSDSASLDPYVPNFGAAPSAAAAHGPRLDYDGDTLAAKGLLVEEQRTNLVRDANAYDVANWSKTAGGTGSVPVVTAADAIAPDGTLTAQKVVFDRGAGNTSSDNSTIGTTVSSYAASTAYIGSLYIKAATVGDVGKQVGWRHVGESSYGIITLTASWQRVTRTETSVDTSSPFQLVSRGGETADNTVGVHLWGVQLEVGSGNAATTFATSLIVTNGATVTRNADAASVGTSQFPYSASEGTLVVAWMAGRTSGPAPALVLDDTDSTQYSNVVFMNQGDSAGAGSGWRAIGNVSGTAQFDFDVASPALAVGATYKLALALKQDDFAAVLNGGTVQTDPTGSVTQGIDLLRIGGHRDGTNINGWIRQITYIPRRLTNAELQARTA